MRRTGRGSTLLAGTMAFAVGISLAACGGDDDDTSGQSAGEQAATEVDSEAVLGEPNPASGEAVKVGLISNGEGQGFDTAIDEPVAQAGVEWLNEYRAGIGGRPVELITCWDNNDPGGAADCSNQMIEQQVVAVIYGANGQFEASWRSLSEAGIPTFILATGATEAPQEATNTFLLNNSMATTIDGPLGVAQEQGADIVSVVPVDVPAATVNYREGRGPQAFEDAGIELDLVPVPIGTPDMTPQMTEIVGRNPDGVVNVLGIDAFCIAAFNGLRTAGYTGTVMANEGCISDAVRTAVPADFLEGVKIVVQVPLNDADDPSTQLYLSVLDKYAAEDVDRTDPEGGYVFLALTGLDGATEGLEGDVTPSSIAAAAKSMEFSEHLGSGGRHFRCNGAADPTQPAVCSNAVLTGELDAEGHTSNYEVLGDDDIPDAP